MGKEHTRAAAKRRIITLLAGIAAVAVAGFATANPSVPPAGAAQLEGGQLLAADPDAAQPGAAAGIENAGAGKTGETHTGEAHAAAAQPAQAAGVDAPAADAGAADAAGTSSGNSGTGSIKPFVIEVVDAATGRGVPLVELTTVSNLLFVTDSAGLAAISEPELMGRRVYFHVRSHGYEFAADGFGFRGRALDVTPGGTARLEIARQNLAERLYRVTGSGIYRDSVLAGRAVPLAEPLLAASLTGCDSVLNAIYQGRLFWVWGDTNRDAYPLGNFHVTAATSALPADGGLDPAVGVDLHYYITQQGTVRPMAKMPGEGPTWITALAVASDEAGRERLFAWYVKVKGWIEVYARGLAEFDPQAGEFRHVRDIPLDQPVVPDGHALLVEESGERWLYFGNPFPMVRVPYVAEAAPELDRYEAFTCLVPGSRPQDGRIARDERGRVVWSWQRGTPPLSPQEEQRLLKRGVLPADAARWQLRDRDTGKALLAHRGSTCYNAYRNRYVAIVCESGGTSPLGELWYAEADTPLGPWAYAVKIVTHNKYSFYNPKQHPYFDQEGGRLVYFEGTYTTLFSGNPCPTPRYDYNQVMYRLDLAEPRVAVPVAVYDGSGEGRAEAFSLGPAAVGSHAFRALDRPLPGAVAVYLKTEGGRPAELMAVPAATEQAANTLQPPQPQQPANTQQPRHVERSAGPTRLFYALPHPADSPSSHTVPLYGYVSPDGMRRVYALEGQGPADWQRDPSPVCCVWP
jgi:hypothetical protein